MRAKYGWMYNHSMARSVAATLSAKFRTCPNCNRRGALGFNEYTLTYDCRWCDHTVTLQEMRERR